MRAVCLAKYGRKNGCSRLLLDAEFRPVGATLGVVRRPFSAALLLVGETFCRRCGLFRGVTSVAVFSRGRFSCRGGCLSL